MAAQQLTLDSYRPTAPTPRPVTVEEAPAPMKRQRPALPPMPPRVIACPKCSAAAYMVLSASARGYSYHCSQPDRHAATR